MSGVAVAVISAALRSCPGVRRGSMPARLPNSPISKFPNRSHSFVAGPAAPLGRHPIDDLIGIHDVAGLAVDAVRCVDLELLRAVAGVDHFVDVRRAEANARIA